MARKIKLNTARLADSIVKPDPIQQALIALSGRGYRLDHELGMARYQGRLISLPDLVRQANQVLRAQGKSEICYPGVENTRLGGSVAPFTARVHRPKVRRQITR